MFKPHFNNIYPNKMYIRSIVSDAKNTGLAENLKSVKQKIFLKKEEEEKEKKEAPLENKAHLELPSIHPIHF